MQLIGLNNMNRRCKDVYSLVLIMSQISANIPTSLPNFHAQVNYFLIIPLPPMNFVLKNVLITFYNINADYLAMNFVLKNVPITF